MTLEERIEQLEESQDSLLDRIRALEVAVDELDTWVWRLREDVDW